ncbi:hypothetical protein JXL21_11085 [Candidatus Bathyarchaeota archaeon]|nr:hypothetical protein [Candidatus Bathyarchaeota archaeon]
MKYRKGDVWRITVDERLDEKIVRFLVAEMKKSVDIGVVIDEEIWGDETEYIITSDDISWIHHKGEECYNCWSLVKKAWGIHPKRAPEWSTIAEGQVYLSGSFDMVNVANSFVIRRNPRKRTFIRVDNRPEIKDDLKWLYNEVLTRRLPG